MYFEIRNVTFHYLAKNFFPSNDNTNPLQFTDTVPKVFLFKVRSDIGDICNEAYTLAAFLTHTHTKQKPSPSF